jgi:hypothetical protein
MIANAEFGHLFRNGGIAEAAIAVPSREKLADSGRAGQPFRDVGRAIVPCSSKKLVRCPHIVRRPLVACWLIAAAGLPV